MKVIIVLLAILIGSTHEHNVINIDINIKIELEECCNCTKSTTTTATTTTTTTTTTIPTTTSEQVLLVATGDANGIGRTNQSQVVDLNADTTCSNLQPFPHAIYRAAGGVLNGHPVICGGWTGTKNGDESACYRHVHYLNEWTLLGNLNTARHRHASALLNGDLWMTGGYNRSDNTGLASTELVSQDGTISDGTPLPVARSRHCMVTLHDGRVMILGGMPGSVRKSVLIFDASDNSFINGADSPYYLIDGVCTIFHSAMHENRPVVFAGYIRPKPSVINKAQLLDYTLKNTWEEISDLPTSSSLYGAVALPTLTGDGVIVQNYQYFYQLNCNASSCDWETLEKELSLPVHFAVAMDLPAEYTCE